MSNGTERAELAVEAWDGTRMICDTSQGRVVIRDVTIHEEGSGNAVMVKHGEHGDHEVVIVNPPSWVEDPDGEREINGKNYRYDPIGALAEAIAMHGGGAG